MVHREKFTAYQVFGGMETFDKNCIAVLVG